MNDYFDAFSAVLTASLIRHSLAYASYHASSHNHADDKQIAIILFARMATALALVTPSTPVTPHAILKALVKTTFGPLFARCFGATENLTEEQIKYVACVV
jgi:hypothetical protein